MQEGSHPPLQLPCWTKWIKENKHQLAGILSSWPYTQKFLKVRDSRFRYTVVHALMAGDIEEKEVIRQCFNTLQKLRLISLITAKDKEGDTPLHSAIRSGTKPELIKLLMTAIPGMKIKRRLLMERNKRGELPIVSAFNLQRWSIVEVLLEECIRCQVLPELTGIGNDLGSKHSNTLLIKAMKRGFIPYLKIYLDVYKRCTNAIPIQAMLVQDKWGRTPWYYFLSRDVNQVEEGLNYLKEHEIDVNKLLCDRNGRTGLLHEAFRRDNKDMCELLVKHGANRNQLDANNLSPPQRKRIISLHDSRPESPVNRGSVVLRPVSLFTNPTLAREAKGGLHEELEVKSKEERNKEERNEGEKSMEERNEEKRDEEERSEQDQASDIERELVQPEQHERGSGDEGEDNIIARTEGEDSDNQSFGSDTTQYQLSESQPSEPATRADDERRLTPLAVRLNLLDALNLEYPWWCKFSGRSRSLSPREEETSDKSAILYTAPRPFRMPPYFKWFPAHRGGRLVLLKWYSPTPSFFTELIHQPEEKEPEFCPIYCHSNMYISSFNTLSPMMSGASIPS